MMQIRPYQKSDFDEVWALHNLALQDVGAHVGNGPWDDDLKKIDEVYQNNGGCFLVGIVEGRIVAIGALKRTDAECAEIKRMRVHPNFQRRGFGSAVLERLEAEARQLGYGTLHLDTTTRQTAAQRLYTKHGYHEIGRTVVAGFDTILLEKKLK